jgi:hypothetical protein
MGEHRARRGLPGLKAGLRVASLLAAVATLGCATPPAVKRDYLYEAAWRGAALTTIGRQMVVDSAAGSAPQTMTLVDVDQQAKVSGDFLRRARILDRRREAVRAELVRNGIAPDDIGEESGNGPDGAQTFPSGELQAKRMVIVSHD